jgi:hypothetical protein
MKFRFLSIIALSILLISTNTVYSANSEMNRDKKSVPTIELNTKAFETIQEKTYATNMQFNGESSTWTAQCNVSKIIKETINKYKVNICISPKVFCEEPDAKYTSYSILSKNGCLSGKLTLNPNDIIELETDNFIPLADESITIIITQSDKTETIILTNTFPNSIIPAKQALENVFLYYKSIFGRFPTCNFSFSVSLLDNMYWIVSFDDNDGIGGQTYVTVNASTGEIIDMKTDE